MTHRHPFTGRVSVISLRASVCPRTHTHKLTHTHTLTHCESETESELYPGSVCHHSDLGCCRCNEARDIWTAARTGCCISCYCARFTRYTLCIFLCIFQCTAAQTSQCLSHPRVKSKPVKSPHWVLHRVTGRRWESYYINNYFQTTTVSSY